jgi:lipid II isoglutaminyl synthase (glutamine-hydrolysing)
VSSARARFALSAGRVAGWASKATGRGAGTQISGRTMLAIAPDLLAEVARGRRVAVVSATNGKTTTAHLLTEALRGGGHAVASNHTGANMPAGIAAALGRSDAPVAVLEIDERWVAPVAEQIDVELLVLGNLTRDQLDRFGEVRSIAERWRALIAEQPEIAVVANASDPHVVWAVEPARSVTWIALGAPWRSDAATCPRCAALLQWSTDRFDCPACRFAQPVTANQLDGDVVALGDRRVPLPSALPGHWNTMNAALALTAAIEHFDVKADAAASALDNVRVISGRFSSRTLPDGRDVRVVLAKNPAGWTEVLRWLAGTDTGVVLAVNAHVADGRDPSWLYDVPYELLDGMEVAASGERALDVGVRLQYAGIACVVEPDPLRAAAALKSAELQIIASYTQFTALTKEAW